MEGPGFEPGCISPVRAGRPPRADPPPIDLYADGRSRTATGRSPHGSEPCMSTCSDHVRLVVWAGIEPASPGLQPGACTVSATTPMVQHEKRRADSNRRVQRCRLLPRRSATTLCLHKAPEEGVEPKPSPGSEPGVLPVRRPRTGIRQLLALLQFPLSRRYRCPADVSRRLPSSQPALHRTPAPARLTASVRVLPSCARVFPECPGEDSNLSFTAPDLGGRRPFRPS